MTTTQPGTDLEVRHATMADQLPIRRMLELYQHDLSDIWDQDLDLHGEYGYALERYWSEALHQAFAENLSRASPDFQTEHGYPDSAPGKANLTMCSNYVAETFGCLAMTLEMPFKDNRAAPDERTGWSPTRCRKLGISNLDALRGILDEL